MARDAMMEERLLRWAQWVTVGDGSGYPSMNVLCSEWQPPSPGMTPTLKANAASDARETHCVVGRLSVRLSNTLVVHYCLRLPLTEQAARLACSASTVIARIDKAHRELMGSFAKN